MILPNSLVSIEYALFRNCKNLELLEIPGSVVKISQYRGNNIDGTFENCINLSKLRLTCSSEELVTGYHWYVDHDYIFYAKSWDDWTRTIKELYIDRELRYEIPVPNLEKLELGEWVKKVQIKNIASLIKIKSIYSYALVPPELPKLFYKQYSDVTVYVPEAALDAYKNAKNWKDFWNIVPISTSGVVDVEADSNEPVHIYNMNGIEMTDKESLPSGIYIERQGTKSRKIVVR